MICNAGEGFISCTGAAALAHLAFCRTQTDGNPFGEVFFDKSQMADHRFAHMKMIDL